MMDSTIKHLTSPALRGKRTFEILIVDDGSSDNTSEAALKLASKYPKCEIKVVTLEKNIGKGGAVRHGMLHASGERLLMADADGASRIEDLEGLWKAMDVLSPNNEAAMVIGSRAHLVKSEAVVKVRAHQHPFLNEASLLWYPAVASPQYPHAWPTYHSPNCGRRTYP